MRKIVAAAFVSLDGVMQAPGGPQEDPSGGFTLGGWTFPYWEDADALGSFMGAMFEAPFDLLLGRKTYDVFAAHWPFVGDDDPMGALFGKVKKYVATSSPASLTWEHSVALTGDVAERVAALKQEDGPILLTQGSSVLLQTLLADGLVDELRLLTFPVVLGKGKRFFSGGAAPEAWTLASQAVSTTGVVMAVYERAGAVRTGSFALETPTEAEIARREQVAREG